MKKVIEFVCRDSAIEMSYKPTPAYIRRCRELGISFVGNSFKDPKVRNIHPYIARRSRSASRFSNLVAFVELNKNNLTDDEMLKILGAHKIKDIVKEKFAPLLSLTTPEQVANGITLLDPMAGGGSIPLEATLMGYKTIAMDYNALSYLLLKTTIFYPSLLKENLLNLLDEFLATLSSEVKDKLEPFYSEKIDSTIYTFSILKNGEIIPMFDKIKLRGTHTINFSTKGRKKDFSLWFSQQRELILRNKKEYIKIHYPIAIVSKEKKIINVDVDREEIWEMHKNCLDEIEKYKYIFDEILKYNIPLSNISYSKILKSGGTKFVLLMNPRQLLSLLILLDSGIKIIEREFSKYKEVLGAYFSIVVSRFWNFNNILVTWNYNTKTLRDSSSSYYRSRTFNIGKEYAEGNVRDILLDWVIGNNDNKKGGLMPIMKLLVRQLKNVKTTPKIVKGSALHLSSIIEEKVDVINVDPPYGDIHRYSDFSEHFLWIIHYIFKKLNLDEIDFPAKREEEIIAKAPRDIRYYRMFKKFLEECYKVLKDDGVLIVWFNHKEIEVWKNVIRAILESGFKITQLITLVSEHPTRIAYRGKSNINRIILIVCRKNSGKDPNKVVEEFLELLRYAKIFPEESITKEELELYAQITKLYIDLYKDILEKTN